uniref:SAM domain-containing protein n=2 Tax=Octactis speculum TaxID=3111310 RepID=A0A7S2DNY1_9STRA|mmetsp:Transcript_51989/g.70954  ORF Transcript_51989/g.70954 Transcript_51989/m.70954 type:complete len:137 (+) Transcript_51989:45-455(+)
MEGGHEDAKAALVRIAERVHSIIVAAKLRFKEGMIEMGIKEATGSSESERDDVFIGGQLSELSLFLDRAALSKHAERFFEEGFVEMMDLVEADDSDLSVSVGLKKTEIKRLRRYLAASTNQTHSPYSSSSEDLMTI